MQSTKEINFDLHGDMRGKLIALEANNQIPFEIKRIFYIYDTADNCIRGCHANRKSEFVIISVSGSVSVKIHDGKETSIFTLDKPDKGLYTPKMSWKEMYNFSSDCVLLVLSNYSYDANEYIRNFDEFIKESREL